MNWVIESCIPLYGGAFWSEQNDLGLSLNSYLFDRPGAVIGAGGAAPGWRITN